MKREIAGRVALAALLLAAVVRARAADRAGEAEAKGLVAMVRGELAGGSTSGAALVFGIANDRLYLVTANHVVRRGGREATDLSVELRALPGEPLAAELLAHRDPDLDLAVLVVRGVGPRHIPVDEISFRRLGDPGALARGDEVFSVGQARSQAWWTNVEPDLVAATTRSHVDFESSALARGQSGGGLFDGGWRLVGLVVGDEAPDGRAVRIDAVEEFLRASGYPVRWRVTPRSMPPPAAGKSYPCDGRVAFRDGVSRRVYPVPNVNAVSTANLPEGTSLRILRRTDEGLVWYYVGYDIEGGGSGWMLRRHVEPSDDCPTEEGDD